MMTYTLEQALGDKTKFEQMAKEAEERGDMAETAIWRVEASNCLERVGMKKQHKPNLGPYSVDNPCHCVDCGKPKDQWIENEECVPKQDT